MKCGIYHKKEGASHCFNQWFSNKQIDFLWKKLLPISGCCAICTQGVMWEVIFVILFYFISEI